MVMWYSLPLLHSEKLIWLVLTMLFMVMETSVYDDRLMAYFSGIIFQGMCK